MKKVRSYPSRQGFTLVELLTVIAIIGILAAILIPAAGLIQNIANRMASASDMGNIAKSHLAYRSATGRTRVITETKMANNEPAYSATANGFAAFLADKIDEMNNPEIWVIEDDPAFIDSGGVLPSIIVDEAGAIQSPWESVALAYSAVVNIPGNVEQTVYPLLFTRGLGQGDTAAEWPDDGPWGSDGGHIAYLGGNVEWYDELGAEELRDYDDPSVGTDNILEAVKSPDDILEPAAGGGGGED